MSEQKVTVVSIPTEIAAAHRAERAVDLAEIEAWLMRFGDEDIEDMEREDMETDLELVTETYVPALLDEVRGAENALLRAGIPDDGRPLAERIATLDARLAGLAEEQRRHLVSDDAISIARRRGDLTQVPDEVLDAAINVVSEQEAVAQTLADLTREHRILLRLQREAARRIEAGYRHTERMHYPGALAKVKETLAALGEDALLEDALLERLKDPAFREAFNGSTARIVVLNAPVPPERRDAAGMREYINGEFGLTISVTDLAQALGISEEDMAAIEAGTKSTDAAGWLTMQTACFLLGSGTKAEHIADPASSPAFARAMAMEDGCDGGHPGCSKCDAMDVGGYDGEGESSADAHDRAAGVDPASERRLVEHFAATAGPVVKVAIPLRRPPLTMIVAIARNGVIGKGAGLPWRIPEDLRHFKRETMGHALIVGRKTAETLPPLDYRRVIVVSRNGSTLVGSARIWGIAPSFEAALDAARGVDPHPIVIGGAEVYRAAMPFVTRILLTEIDHDYEGDVRFELDRTGFVETDRRAGETPGVSFVTLERTP